MKKRIMIPVMLTVASVLAYSQKSMDDFSGKWKTPEGKTILISKSGNIFAGTTEDTRQKIIENVQFTDGHWRGTIFKPGSSTKASCEMTIEGNKLTVVARKAMFSKTIVWTKL